MPGTRINALLTYMFSIQSSTLWGRWELFSPFYRWEDWDTWKYSTLAPNYKSAEPVLKQNLHCWGPQSLSFYFWKALPRQNLLLSKLFQLFFTAWPCYDCLGSCYSPDSQTSISPFEDHVFVVVHNQLTSTVLKGSKLRMGHLPTYHSILKYMHQWQFTSQITWFQWQQQRNFFLRSNKFCPEWTRVSLHVTGNSGQADQRRTKQITGSELRTF